MKKKQVTPAGNDPDRWLHRVYLGRQVKDRRWYGDQHIRTIDLWGVRRNGAKRILRTFKDLEYCNQWASWFSQKHQLKLFYHDKDGIVEATENSDLIPTGVMGMTPSKDFKTFYNEQMLNKLKTELPNIDSSETIKEMKVRSRFKGTETPEKLTVWVRLHSGEKFRIVSDVKGYPSPELITKIALLRG